VKNFKAVCLALGLLCLAFLPAAAMAQSDSSSQAAQEMRKQLDELREQMNKLQARLDELESRKAAEAPAAPAASAAGPPSAVSASSQEGTIQTAVPPAQGPTSKQVGEATATYSEFSEDTLAAARFDNVPLDPKYHGFFRLPGTQTLLKIGGYFKTDFIYDLKPAGNTDSFIPSSFPVPQPTSVNNSTVSIRPTRLSLDFRVPTSTKFGEVRFYLEGDLFGTNATTPRLRHAYAQVRNVLIGQTFSNFMDPDAFPDTLDFQGPNGMVSIRNPQLRYGFALSPSTTLYLSVEKPSSDVAFKPPTASLQSNAPGPDGAIRLRQEFERGHIQVAAIFRSIEASVTTVPPKSDTAFGWGINVSTGFRTFGKDNAIFAVAAGHGISRYIQDTSGLGIDAEPDSSTRLKATPAVGVEASYQHYWFKRLRSSAIYSYAAVNNTAFDAAVATPYNHGTYTGANLIWNPFGSLNVGAEFLYGWTMLQNGQSANVPRFQLSAKYSFVKVDADQK
jgi:hypothetical protein